MYSLLEKNNFNIFLHRAQNNGFHSFVGTSRKKRETRKTLKKDRFGRNNKDTIKPESVSKYLIKNSLTASSDVIKDQMIAEEYLGKYGANVSWTTDKRTNMKIRHKRACK